MHGFQPVDSSQLTEALPSGCLLKPNYVLTGWSKETVDCKFLLTDPKFPKSVLTQWFLESLYREVLVFWCFKSVRCVELCLLMYFQYWAFVASDKAWALQNTLTHIQTPKTYIHFTLMFTITSSRYLRTIQDKNRHQQKLIDTNRHQQTVPGNPKCCSRMRGASCWHQMAFAGVCWCLLVSDGVFQCPMVSGDLRRVSEELLKGYLCAVYGLV